MTLGTYVDAPPAREPRVGLLASAVVTIETTESHWGQGVQYLPEGCGVGGVIDLCESGAKTIGSNATVVSSRPFGVWAGFKCSTLGFSMTDFVGRASRQLLSSQSFQIEREFMSGALASAMGYPNAYLDNGDDTAVVAGTGSSPLEAMARMEKALGSVLKGAPGMIHAPRNLVSVWSSLNLLRREGSIIRTINDTIVVPGAGYGQDDNTGYSYAWGTELIEIRLGPVRVVPDNETFARVDTETNTIEVRAERAVEIMWPGCAHLSIGVTVPNSAI